MNKYVFYGINLAGIAILAVGGAGNGLLMALSNGCFVVGAIILTVEILRYVFRSGGIRPKKAMLADQEPEDSDLHRRIAITGIVDVAASLLIALIMVLVQG